MKKGIKILAVAVMSFAAVACSSVSKMAELAENVKVTCDPEVLEVVANKVDANITVTVPAGYFKPKAIVKVTPVLVYNGGEAEMAPFTYQGEKVKDNYTVVSKNGQTIVEHVQFPYVKGMEQATLELRGVASIKAKSVNLPVKKVAVGCNTTYMLVHAEGVVSYKADNYMEVIPQTAEAQILYNINSADLRSKELKSASVKDFQEALKEIKANERKTLVSTEVVAYASPDGAENLNNKLADNRAKSGNKAWNKVVKDKEVAAPAVKGLGEDWEGFQTLVKNSNLADKDLILRVLSMYSDPAVRESEIKNMSEVFTSLKKEILPALRRSRLIANVEYQNYTKEELLKLIDENIDVLDEEALLRSATLVKKADEKISIYEKAVKKFGSDRAQFNIGVAYLNAGETAKAEAAFNKVATKDADLENALGVIALRKGDYAAAAKKFAAAATEDAKDNMATLNILTGNYKAAAAALDGKTGFNAALAQVLVKNYDKASKALTCKCPHSSYLRAVIAARQGKVAEAKENLEKACKVPALAERAATDIEFATIK